MAAVLVGAARATAGELDPGNLVDAVVRCERGLILVEAGPEAVLAGPLQAEANLGLALLTMSRVASRVTQSLEAMCA